MTTFLLVWAIAASVATVVVFFMFLSLVASYTADKELKDTVDEHMAKSAELRERAIKAERELHEAQTARDSFKAGMTTAQEGQRKLIAAAHHTAEGMRQRVTRIRDQANEIIEIFGDHSGD